MPLSWSDAQPLHNGPDRDTDAWAYWLGAAPGADPGAPWDGPPAPDGPGAGPAGAGADRQAGTGGHGAAAGQDQDWRTPTPLSAIPAGPVPSVRWQLLHPEPGAVTVVYGDGGVGKGTLAAWVAAQASHEGLVMLLDAEGHPREWRRRVEGLGGRLERTWWVGHPGGRVEPQDYAAAGVSLVVVDSAAYFTPKGAEPWGPDAAVAMQEAARASGVPWLVLAHIPKSGDVGKAYGSTFWHNVPRASHGLVALDDGTRVLTCRKATDLGGLERGQEWAFTVAYAEDGVTPISVQLRPWQGAMPEPERRLLAFLADWRTKGEVAEELGIGLRTAQAMLNSRMDLEVSQPDGPRGHRYWRRVAR